MMNLFLNCNEFLNLQRYFLIYDGPSVEKHDENISIHDEFF